MLTKILFDNSVLLYLIFRLWGQSDPPFKKNSLSLKTLRLYELQSINDIVLIVVLFERPSKRELIMVTV